MEAKDVVITRIKEHITVAELLLQDTIAIEKALAITAETVQTGRTVFFCGNGGSAADAQHLAAEFVGRFVRERDGLPAVALTTDTSILTAVGNDYGFDTVFSRQVKALARPGDLVIGLSTSGNSANVLAAFEAAKTAGAKTIAFTGRTGGKMKDIADCTIAVPADVTARTQEMHIMIGHILCEWIDEVTDHVAG